MLCRYAFTKALVVAFILTFFSIFDVPVFWPILLLYWVVLFVLTMKRQIRHMIKYRYIPFSLGKQVCHFLFTRSSKDFQASEQFSQYHLICSSSWFMEYECKDHVSILVIGSAANQPAVFIRLPILHLS